jgi:hypothetical protein
MKAFTKNQRGFSLIETVMMLLVVAAVVGVGFYVFKNKSQNMTENSQTTTNETSNTVTETPKEEYVVPEDYVVYENKELGFKFIYPKAWGGLQTKSDANYAFSAATNDNDTTNSGDTLRLFANNTDSFSLEAVYHGAEVKPIKSDGGYVWEVVEPNTQFETLTVGDSYEPQPKVVLEKDELKVYEFPNAHANAVWSALAFSVKDTFVAIVTPVESPSIELVQTEYDKMIADYKDIVSKVAQSIRAL